MKKKRNETVFVFIFGGLKLTKRERPVVVGFKFGERRFKQEDNIEVGFLSSN